MAKDLEVAFMQRVLEEPSEHEFHFMYPCLALRQRELMIWCGYVGVGPRHAYYSVPYQDMPPIEVHGGLTFSGVLDRRTGKHNHGDIWWFGFDCGHSFDIAPGAYGMPDDYWRMLGATYKDLEYVMGQCMRLASQLYDLRLPRDGRCLELRQVPIEE